MSPSRQFIELTAQFQEQNYSGPPSPAQLLLEYGRHYGERRSWSWRGTPRACYANAQHLARRVKGLRYVEGFASSVIPLEHAWLIDEQNRVVDLTWDEKYEPDYFGVVLDLDFVRSLRKRTRSYSALFDWLNWPKTGPLVEAHIRKKHAPHAAS